MDGYGLLYPEGQLEKGNLDVNKAIAKVKNKDGSISTVRNTSFNFGDGEVLIPTVHPDGYIMNDKEAVEYYKKTGKSFGTFATPEHATEHAKNISAYHDMKFNSDRKKKQSAERKLFINSRILAE